MSSSREDDAGYTYKKRDLWSDDETELLVHLYGREIHQWLENTPRKYASIESYTNIAHKLKEAGYNRSAHQVRNKLKALRSNYFAAASGTELDRQNCFMFQEMDKYFRHLRDDSSLKYEASNDNSSSQSDRSRKHRQFEEISIKSECHDIVDDENENNADNQSDYSPADGDDDSEYIPTRKCKRPRITTTTTENIETIPPDSMTLVDFMSDQLEKQRQHQVEITKIFTNAMSQQFDKFSKLISNLTQQMLDNSRKVISQSDENRNDVEDDNKV